MSIINKQITKIYIGAEKVYSIGAIVHYVIDGSNIVSEERDEGDNALIPTTFTPSKSGWTFKGWRKDTSANGTTLTNELVGDQTLTLYAVFSKDVTVTYYDNSTNPSYDTKQRYYNNSNITNPTFTLTQSASSGWTARGWSTTNAGNAAITYGNGASFTRDSNITIYGLYQKTLTLTYAGNGHTGGSTTAQTGTMYWAPAGNVYPSFTLNANGFTKTNYTFAYWTEGSTSGTVRKVGTTVSISEDRTFYAYWVQTTKSYSYTGGVQSFTAPIAGTYKLEAYGAQGGNAYTSGAWSGYTRADWCYGGYGGYSYGNVSLTAGQTIYIVVGGQASTSYADGGWGDGDGGSTSGGSPGYNGGGRHGSYSSGSGGGATHIAKTNRGVLSNYASYKNELYIVAGGGGGGASIFLGWSEDENCGRALNANGGTGGGTSGGQGGYISGFENYAGARGAGGTQSSAGANGGFGYGGSVGASWEGAGGGGGYYGGGRGGNYNGGNTGGGGSGYIGGVSGGSTQNGKQSGNGKAAITFISAT